MKPPFVAGSGQHRLGFHREQRSPGVVATCECDGIYTSVSKLLRRTDARRFVQSGAIGDDEPNLVFWRRPLVDVIGEHPYAPRDLGLVLFVAGT